MLSAVKKRQADPALWLHPWQADSQMYDAGYAQVSPSSLSRLMAGKKTRE